tara:strand:- start:9235 stop:10242 length:1008 start_codon:yes stop_codon:yes gene_type:complete
MTDLFLKRREFIKLGVGISVLGLIGCTRQSGNSFVLRTSTGTLPKQLLLKLPSEWRGEEIDIDSEINPYKELLSTKSDLIAIQDGWMDGILSSDLLPMNSLDLLPILSSQATNFIKAFGTEFEDKILPIGVNPWVMVFRNGEPWLETAKESWEVLLDPYLKNQIILPNSSRLVISIAEKMGDINKLKKLRQQVKTYDDVNALNWILSGKARVAVLPLQRCISNLIRDQRLSVVLPQSGSPLNWTLLAKPVASQKMLPLSWFMKTWSQPFLRRLLNNGWVPPISYSELLKEKMYLRKDLQSTIVPSRTTWENCWSLLPLTKIEKKDLAERWILSAP